ncbi:hypothetical protein MTO96_037197 [Rhipicephalus appendiculatus]
MKGAVVLFVLTAIASQFSVNATGEWTEQDPSSDPKYLELAHFAISQQITYLTNYNTVFKLLKVKTQIVGGVDYKLVFMIAPSNCSIAGGPYSSESCKPTPDLAAGVCTAVVYERPWEDYRTLKSISCRK